MERSPEPSAMLCNAGDGHRTPLSATPSNLYLDDGGGKYGEFWQ